VSPADTAEALRRARAEHDAVFADGRHVLQQLGLRDVPDPDSDLTIEMALEPRVTNPRGGLQGGLMATMADVVAGRAVFAEAPAGSSCLTSDLTIHYLRPLTGGPARARARVVQRGRRRAVVNVEIVDVASGRLAATCSVAFSIVPGDPDSAGVLET
jgi:uncharacterized protein (TIGR00369 family)